MKKIIIFMVMVMACIHIFTNMSIVTASDQSFEEKYKICTEIANYGELIMTGRQMGWSELDMRQKYTNGEEALLLIISMAFEHGVYNTDQYKNKIILEFRSNIFDACMGRGL